MSKKDQIHIDCSDWGEEYDASPIKPKNMTDIVEAMQETSMKPLEASRLAIISQTRGDTDEEILPQPKSLLMTGGAVKISQHIAQQRKPIKVNQHEWQARKYVASTQVERDAEQENQESSTGGGGKKLIRAGAGKIEPTLVEVGEPLAIKRAKQYIFSVITGSIKERLTQIAFNSVEDAREVAEELKDRIDGIVSSLE